MSNTLKGKNPYEYKTNPLWCSKCKTLFKIELAAVSFVKFYLLRLFESLIKSGLTMKQGEMTYSLIL